MKLILSCALSLLGTMVARAQDAAPKYPLRLHILAVDQTERTLGLNTAGCSSGSMPVIGEGGSVSGGSNSGGCGRGIDPDTDWGFSGAGRGDLVSPPTATQGLTYNYEACNRVRVPAGFVSLQARWKKQGKTLEVLVPSDEVPKDDHPIAPQRCTLKVTLQDFVYLRAKSGALVKVSQAEYWKRPALRALLSGGAQSQTLQKRTNGVLLSKPATP